MPALTSTYALAAVAAFGGSCAGTAMLVRLLTRRNVLDRPNARSSHDTPKPRGGGNWAASASRSPSGRRALQAAICSRLSAQIFARMSVSCTRS